MLHVSYLDTPGGRGERGEGRGEGGEGRGGEREGEGRGGRGGRGDTSRRETFSVNVHSSV